MVSSMSSYPEIAGLIREFRDNYLATEEVKNHINVWKEKETNEGKEILKKLKALPEDSDEFEARAIPFCTHYNARLLCYRVPLFT